MVSSHLHGLQVLLKFEAEALKELRLSDLNMGVNKVLASSGGREWDQAILSPPNLNPWFYCPT